MKSKINKKDVISEVYAQIVDQIIRKFGQTRLKCIITYGSAFDIKELNPKDIDIFVLLTEYNVNDYLYISEIKKNVPEVSIFIDYLDWIQQRGLNNYQFGRHGVYFLKILSNGICLYGENEYKKLSKKISMHKINSDLRYRIDEYFYRIYKEITTDSDFLIIRKYLCRIIVDLLLIERKVSFKEVARSYYLNLISSYCQNNVDPRAQLFAIVLNMNSISYYKEVLKIVPKLYKIYLKTYN